MSKFNNFSKSVDLIIKNNESSIIKEYNEHRNIQKLLNKYEISSKEGRTKLTYFLKSALGDRYCDLAWWQAYYLATPETGSHNVVDLQVQMVEDGLIDLDILTKARLLDFIGSEQCNDHTDIYRNLFKRSPNYCKQWICRQFKMTWSEFCDIYFSGN